MDFAEAFEELPLISILKDMTPDECRPIVSVLYNEGIRIFEVPLDDDVESYEMITRLAELVGDKAVVAAGSVISVDQIARAQDAGAAVILSPDSNAAVIEATIAAEMTSCPGICSPTEALTSIRAGADLLSLFPAALHGPEGLVNLKAVLPASARLLPVGGIDVSNVNAWRRAGADGAGVGTGMFRPGIHVDLLRAGTRRIVTAWRG